MGLGSALLPAAAESISTLSSGSLTGGMDGSGGGCSSSVTDGLRRRKKLDVFFCSVWVADWCDSRDGGADDLGWREKAEAWGEGAATGAAAALDEPPPNMRRKKPCFSLGWGVTAAAAAGGISFAFS